MERGGHIPIELPQVALTGDQAVGVTAVAAAEHCRRAAALVRDGVRQFSDAVGA